MIFLCDDIKIYFDEEFVVSYPAYMQQLPSQSQKHLNSRWFLLLDLVVVVFFFVFAKLASTTCFIM